MPEINVGGEIDSTMLLGGMSDRSALFANPGLVSDGADCAAQLAGLATIQLTEVHEIPLLMLPRR